MGDFLQLIVDGLEFLDKLEGLQWKKKWNSPIFVQRKPLNEAKVIFKVLDIIRKDNNSQLFRITKIYKSPFGKKANIEILDSKQDWDDSYRNKVFLKNYRIATTEEVSNFIAGLLSQ